MPLPKEVLERLARSRGEIAAQAAGLTNLEAPARRFADLSSAKRAKPLPPGAEPILADFTAALGNGAASHPHGSRAFTRVFLRFPCAMSTPTRPPADSPAVTASGLRDAESLFRSKPIPEIRVVEAATRREIEQKKEELRQLVGKSYRSLIDSADSIILMKTSCDSIFSNLTRIDAALRSLSVSSIAPSDSPLVAPDPTRSKMYGIACRVRYLVDTPEQIWGFLDESMLFDATGRYLRANEVHGLISTAVDPDVLSRFPLLQHQWQIVESFKAQISLLSRDRLMDRGLTVTAYADALAAAATIDHLNPKQVLDIFLESRRSWISQKLANIASDDGPNSSTAILCDVSRIIRATLGQVGQLLRHALNEMPLFYKTVLGSLPGTQLFGGIPNPEQEVKLWKSHREKLESVMVLLEPDFISQACSSWLHSCCCEIFADSPSSKGVIRVISTGEGLMAAEKMVRESLNGAEGLEQSLEEWLRSVFGSNIKSSWKQICGLILQDGKDILEDKMEQAFLLRMREIVQAGFENLRKEVSVKSSLEAIVSIPNSAIDFLEYLKKSSMGGGVWFSELNQRRTGFAQNLKSAADDNDFRSCLNAYFGPEVNRIRDLIDKRLCIILEDLLCFVESHNATLRLKELVPHFQDQCYKALSALLREIQEELDSLAVSLVTNRVDERSQPLPTIVERSLFLGRLLYALRNHSSHIPLILGSPREWVKETIGAANASLALPLSKQSKESINSPIFFSSRRPTFDSPLSPGRHSLETPRRQALSDAVALFIVDNSTNLKHEELSKKLQELCIKAYRLWITWVSDELSIILSKNLNHDDAFSMTIPLRSCHPPHDPKIDFRIPPSHLSPAKQLPSLSTTKQPTLLLPMKQKALLSLTEQLSISPTEHQPPSSPILLDAASVWDRRGRGAARKGDFSVFRRGRAGANATARTREAFDFSPYGGDYSRTSVPPPIQTEPTLEKKNQTLGHFVKMSAS
ncbi:hypothetical protein KSP39_PZI002411 [Platanthera zijinensis]|uniref:Conserved oligomeric Golgi complex subunit 1 n=1 Tax=Platanthera zijinensis TaxID=2320716 RepID=A0AAP0C1M0_9ASPA